LKPSDGIVKKVLGEGIFTADLQFPGMLVGKGLYSSHPRAIIRSVDTNAAEAIEGVHAIATHKDLKGKKRFGVINKDQPIFAIDEVCYIGDMIAAVAAENEEIAASALETIIVEFEPIAGVYDVIEAFENKDITARPDLESNVLYHKSVSCGEVETGFAQSDVHIEESFMTQCAEHLFLETESVIADWDGQNLTIWASGQHPHGDRDQVCEIFGLNMENVRVIYPYVGGAFGGKEDMHIQLQTAVLAMKSFRPVKMVRTRHESFFTHAKRPSIATSYEIGAKFDGSIQAIRVKIVLDSGPYSNLSPTVTMYSAEISSGPYKIPNAQIDAYCVATNNLISGAFRGFGATEIAFAQEQIMDLLAIELRIDPLELRLINGIEKGTHLPTGIGIKHEIGFKETLESAARLANWKTKDHWIERKPAAHLRRGLGFASAFKEVGMGHRREDQSQIRLEVNLDGKLTLFSGSSDFGQGPYFSQALIVSQVLDVDIDDIEVVLPDTDISPDASVTSASRGTYMVGNAAFNASHKIRKILFDLASQFLEVNSDQLEIGKGEIWDRNDPDRFVAFCSLAQFASEKAKPISAEGVYKMWHSADPRIVVEQPEPRSVYAFATQIAQVLVDLDTGQITVEKIWGAYDVGKAINITGVEGQIEGSIVMGVGYTLQEELVQEKGKLLNSHLSEYIAPLITEIPEIDYVIIEVPEPSGPFGAKGVGEIATVPLSAAIANAVTDAIDIRYSVIPLTAERVWSVINQKQMLE
jgi:CO/xanthine dehydrogenase Mo-binding subunit